MTSHRKGMTLMEIIIVLIIVGIATAFTLPNFTTTFEQARAATAQNNLLAIYSAEQNYFNNNSDTYCVSTSALPCDSLADINTAFTLNLQDDGTYLYSCPVGTNTCTATRNSVSNLVITMTLNKPIVVAGEVNPACTSATGNAIWCP